MTKQKDEVNEGEAEGLMNENKEGIDGAGTKKQVRYGKAVPRVGFKISCRFDFLETLNYHPHIVVAITTTPAHR